MACPEGIRMGRRIVTNVGVATITTTASTIVPANRDRIGLILFPDATTAVAIGIDRSLSATSGPLLQAAGVPLRLHIDQDGTLLQKQINGIVVAGTAVIGFIESLLGEAV